MTSSPSPRNGLRRAAQLGVPLDTELQRVLGRWDVDDVFNEDLESMMFEVEPLPSAELDCHNPWMVVIAMNGGGSAYGLYLHPSALTADVAPWVFWEHEEDTIFALAPNTALFFSGFVRQVETWLEEPERIARVRRSFNELDMTCSPNAPSLDEDQGANWLPPLEAALQPLQYYLDQAQNDPAAAEPGLLAHASRNQDEVAKARLETIYEKRGWTLPASGFTF